MAILIVYSLKGRNLAEIVGACKLYAGGKWKKEEKNRKQLKGTTFAKMFSKILPMESFHITSDIDSRQQQILVIPDECAGQSIFHLVINGSECCKLLYSDLKKWEISEESGLILNGEELNTLTRKIEDHYF